MKRASVAAAVVLAFTRAAAAQPVATCSIPNDPQARQWSLERPEKGAPDAPWRVIFKSRGLDKPQTELRLPQAQPLIAAGAVALLFTTANGGRTIEWRAKEGLSSLDIYVNFGLEVNVDADLDPAVEQMNTSGPIAVTCSLPPSLALVGSASFGEAGSDIPGTFGTLGTPGTLAPPGTLGTFGTLRYSEWVVGAGGAWSIRLFQSTGDRWYAVQTVSWGRELTRDLGPGRVRGRLMWAIEATPLFAQARPTHVYGAGVAPVVWRWNFVPRPRWSAFAEMAMGGLWSSAPVPEGTKRANFTAHWGAGIRLHSSASRSFVLAYRLQHISNGNQLSKNPGVNSHVAFVGWSRRSQWP